MIHFKNLQPAQENMDEEAKQTIFNQWCAEQLDN